MDTDSFENFIVSDCNREAFLACSDLGGGRCLILHGPSGAGKTHLLRAMLQKYETYRPYRKARMTTWEALQDEIMACLRTGCGEDWHNKFLEYDLLILDNMQFAAGKRETLEMLYKALRLMQDRGKILVMAMDCPPEELGAPIKKLLSHPMCECRTVRLKEPDTALRKAWLQRLMRPEKLPFSAYFALLYNRKISPCAYAGIFRKWQLLRQQKGRSLTAWEMRNYLKEDWL